MRFLHSRLLSLGLACALVLLAHAAIAADGMEWTFSEFNDPENKGRMTARLSYGVPETDNIQVSGVCDASPSTGVAFSSVTFGTDSGDLKEGADTELRFSGGGFDHVIKGIIHHARAEEGISGVHLDIKHDDPLWQALQEKELLDYMVPGYRASTLDLSRGRDKIKLFIEACRTYAKAILGDKNGFESQPAPGGGTPEKEAFESAKELGTADAWNAFLGNYPSGFHADLARAYLKRLGAGGTAPSPQTDNGVTGINVTYVEYPGGVFIKNGPDTWVEQRKAGGDALRFKETFRSKDEIKLFDKSRKVHISLNVKGGAIWYALDGSPLKKLYDIVSTRGAEDAAPPPVAAPAADPLPTQSATGVSCKKLGTIRSKYSNRPTKISFVNNSGGYRGILWIDFKGQPKEYANLQAGQQITLDTFQTHPWMVTDGPGNCLQMALPRSEPSLVKIGNVEAAPAAAPKPQAQKKCQRGYLRIEGKCIRKRDAATYCGPGYRLQGNKCVQGYQPPAPQAQRPSWQIEAIKKGCTPGQGWNPQEGCHEND